MLIAKRLISATVLIGLVVASGATRASAETVAVPAPSMRINQTMPKMTKMDLRIEMRRLWEDHIIYTRNYIISALAELSDAGVVAERLLENQDEIGAALKPYYGEAAAKKLATLLREHIRIATEVVQAAKGGNKMALDKTQADWDANADAIAAFLSEANPAWNKVELMGMLRKHLELMTGEVTSRIKKDWKADIDYYDKSHTHILMFADVLSSGIAKQFPDKLGQ